ncbi:hypothetical protein BU15DRAFT_91078 [Melanogaster broomeanus]|nr:hypothetical protein BU15DRAFT_91078 [Melanogaster broomeanus]
MSPLNTNPPNEKAQIGHGEAKHPLEDDVSTHTLSLRGKKLTASLAFVAGAGFTLFGYDQGVMSALLTAGQVVVDSSHPNHATLQSFVVAIYEIGCLIGALSNLWVGDLFGRRKTIVLGGCIMIIGAILQATSYSYAQLVVARIITGLGNGLNTSTVPTYHAECSPAAKRGSLIMIEGSLITFGIMISYWASGSSAQWRVPIALQIGFALIMVCGINFVALNQSKRLVKHGRNAEAIAVISALEDKPSGDPDVQRTYYAIREAVEIEEFVPSRSQDTHDTKQKPRPLRELFTNGRSQNFRRASLGTILFQRLGLSDVTSRIIAAANGTEYFLASLIAIFLIDRVVDGSSCYSVQSDMLGSINGSGAQVVSAVLLFFGWLGMTWLYVPRWRFVGLRIRAPANATQHRSPRTGSSTSWVVMVTGPSFSAISWRTYIVFASLNAFHRAYSILLLPRGLLLPISDMDVVFALAYNEGISPVGVSLRKDIPLRGSLEADRILGIQSNATTSGRNSSGED